MNVLIIEDEAPAARRLIDLVGQIDPDIHILSVLDSVRSGREWFSKNEIPDLIFSDIQLSDDLSFDIFKDLQEEVPIIFTTAYDEYVLKAFEHHSVAYLLKPLKVEALKESIFKFKKIKKHYQKINFESLLARFSEREYKKRFLIYSGENLVPISDTEVAYFYAEDGYVFLTSHSGRKYFYNSSLDALEKQLDPRGFFRLNRQYLVSVNSIAQIRQHFHRKLVVALNPPIKGEIFVSKERAGDLKNWLGC